MRLGGQIQQRLVGVGPHRVADHVGDRARRHGGHPQNCGIRAVQHRQGLLHRRPPAPVRAVSTHSTATSGRAVASDRSANSVPLSAQWMSSSTIASGVCAAAA